jgi:peptide/nickel transport system permease protein/oligopeptide transport system permease protein
MALLAFVALMAFVVPFLGIFPYDPVSTTPHKLVPPDARHWFGTDANGRDVFSRVIQGAQVSLIVGLCGAGISFLIGTTYGLIAGYAGGTVDEVMMRIVEILYAVPRLIIVIVVSFATAPALETWLASSSLPWVKALLPANRIIILIICLGVVEWLSMARIVRGQVLALREQQYVQAARALGQSHARIILRHLLPNIAGVVIVYLTLTVPAVILDESFLSFLGLGTAAPYASWGSLLTDGKDVINPVKSYWWLLFFPAAAMSITLLALNFLGDAVRDAFDPRSRK